MGFGRGVEGGPMLSYPSLEVNGATRVGALRLPLEVYLLLGLGVSVGHCGLVDDIFGVAVTRGLPAGPLNGLIRIFHLGGWGALAKL